MAEAWGIPPWQVEDQASALWVDRWLVLQDARSKASAKAKDN